MAPDLNSVPPSPRPLAASSSSPRITSLPASRRASQQMAPPPLPLSAINVLPSNQSAVNNPSVPMASPGLSGVTTVASVPGDNTGVGTGPGPLRHPRPLTAADLHLQLEKEQEAVVSTFLTKPWHRIDSSPRSIVLQENCLCFAQHKMRQWSPIPLPRRRASQTRAITMPTTCSLAQAIQLPHNDDIIAPHLAPVLGAIQQALPLAQAQLAGLQPL
jgi:hypothetical protein